MRIDRLLTLTRQLGFDLVFGKKRGRGARKGRGLVPLECLESRRLLSAAGWTTLAATGTGPTFVEGLELLPDGTVMVQAGQSGPTNTYYQLTPKSTGNVYPGTTTATGNYVNGAWSPLAGAGTASNPAEKRLYNNSVVLPDGRIFTIGGEYSSPEPFSGSSEIFTPSPTGGAWAPTARIPTPPTARFFNSNVITGASTASPIVITATDTTGLFNGEKVTISGVLGNTAANSPTNTPWTISNLTGKTFTLVGSASNGTWAPTSKATFSVSQFGDDPIQLLPNGKILAGFHAGKETFIYDPIADTWTKTADKLRGDSSDEETWIKLPDGSILSYDVEASIASGVFHAQRYDPILNAWVDASRGVDAAHTPSLLSDGSPAPSGAFASPGALQGEELGPAFMMPNGNAIFFGGNGHTAIYNPTTDVWSAGPEEPTKPQSNTITGASNVTGSISTAGASAGSPLVITTSSTAGLSNGDLVTISGLVGVNQPANGNWYVTNLTSTTFQLAFSRAVNSNVAAGNGANTSGGSWFAGIKITTPSTAGLSEGQYVTIAGVGGNTAANGKWTITNKNKTATSFQLVGPKPSVTNFTSGGTWSTSVLTLADASGCMMPNGNILLAFSPLGGLAPNGGYSFPTPTYMYEYNTTTGVYTEVPPPTAITDSSYHTFMLALPSGQVLMGNSDLPGGIEIYTPTGIPQTSWRPTITGIANDVNGTFTLSGTKLKGISEGAAYGDEVTMSTDYPIVQFTDWTGKVTYARSSNWINGGVVAPTVMTSTFTSAPLNGAYLLSVSANGINSKSVLFVQLGVNADNVTIKVDPSNSALVDVYQFTTLLGKFAKSSITAIDVNGLGALNLDYSNGLFAVPINVNGVLAVSSLSFTHLTSITYTADSSSSGAFVINGDSANPVTVTNVNVQAVVTAQPHDLLATSGETAVFTAAAFSATGQAEIAKWQFSTDSGGNWTDDTTDTTTTQTDSSGVTHTRLTFEVSTATDVQYRAAFSSDGGLHYQNTNIANLHIATSTTYWVGGGRVWGTTIGDPAAWNEPLNWTNGIPVPGSVAIFASQVPAYTRWNDTGNMSLTRTAPVNMNSNVNGSYVIGGMYLSSTWGSVLTVEQPLELTGSSEWDSGNISFAGANARVLNDPNSQLTMNNVNYINLTGGGELLNNGTMIQAGSAAATHFLGIDGNATLTNSNTGTFDMEVDGGLSRVPGSTTGNFINRGLLEKTGGTVTTASVISTSITNNSTIDVTEGKLTIVPYTNGADNYVGGHYFVDAGAVLDPTGGTGVNVTGTLTGSGGGQILFSQGILNTNSGATLNFPNSFFQWTGGTLAGNWTNTSYMTLGGSGVKALTYGTTLHNQQTITQTTDALQISGNALLDNQVGAIYNLASDGGISGIVGGNAGGFLNHGLVEKTVGTVGTGSTLSTSFTSDGTINVVAGKLTIAPYSTIDGIANYEGGHYLVNTGAVLDPTGGTTATVTGTLTGSGGGQILFSQGGLQTASSGATFNFPTPFFQWTGGTLTGSWTNTSYMTLSGSGLKLLNGTLHNQKTITETTDSLQIGQLGLFDNPVGATYNLASDGGIIGQIGGHAGNFLNQGFLVKSVGTAATNSLINVNFTSIVGAGGQGSIHVQHGILVIAPAGVSSDLTGNGEPANYIGAGAGSSNALFNLDAGTKLDLTGGATSTANGTLSVIGSGQLALSQGTLQGNVAATFHFPSLSFQWTGGSLAGTWTNTAYLTLAGSGQKRLGQYCVLHNQNTITQTTDSLQITGLALLDNQAGATINLASDGGISGVAASIGSFSNSGILKKTSGTVGVGSSIVTYFTSDGTIDVIAGKLTIAPIGAAIGSDNFNGGSVWVNPGALLDPTGGANVTVEGIFKDTGTGPVTFSQGTLQAGSGGATFDFLASVFKWTGGSLAGSWTNAGYLTLAGSGQKLLSNYSSLHNQNSITQTTDSLQIGPNALLDNQVGATFNLASDGGISGQLNGSTGSFNNAGTLLKSAGAVLSSNKPSIVSVTFTNAAGAGIIVQKGALQVNGDVSNTGIVTINPASKLIVNGNYSQTATATLDIQLGGLPTTGLFGLLSVTPGHVATLGGTLKAELVNGFVPDVGTDFTVMTYDTNQASTFAHFTVPVSLPANVGSQAVTLGKNVAPVGVAKTVTTLEDTAYIFKALDFGFSDPNNHSSNSLLAVKIATLPSLGVLTDNGAAVTVGQHVLATDISAGILKFAPATNANGAAYAHFSFQVQDNGGTTSGGLDTDPTPRTMTVAVTSVNDAPVGTSGTVTAVLSTAYHFKAMDFGFTDANDSPANTLLAVKFSLLPSTVVGTFTDNGAAVTLNQLVSATDISGGKLVFTPASNLLGTSFFLCKFQVQDNGGTATGGVNLDPTAKILKVNIVKINHAPTGKDTTVSMVRNTSYIFKTTDFGFSDPSDSPSNTLLSVLITTQPTVGSLTDNGAVVMAGTHVLLTDITTGKLKFTPATGASGVAYSSFVFQVQDNGGTANGGIDTDPTPKKMTISVI